MWVNHIFIRSAQQVLKLQQNQEEVDDFKKLTQTNH